MSNLIISQRKFIEIIKSHGFYFKRQEASHQQWEGIANEKRRLVSIDVKYDNYSGWLLGSMIRQSGLPKKEFRK